MFPCFGIKKQDVAIKAGNAVQYGLFEFIAFPYGHLMIYVDLQVAQGFSQFRAAICLCLTNVQFDQGWQEFINFIQMECHQLGGVIAVDDLLKQGCRADDVVFADGLNTAEALQQAGYRGQVGGDGFFRPCITCFFSQPHLTLNGFVIWFQLQSALIDLLRGFPVAACQVKIPEDVQGLDIIRVIHQNLAEDIQRICKTVLVEIGFSKDLSDF